jgi:hypothetical protein
MPSSTALTPGAEHSGVSWLPTGSPASTVDCDLSGRWLLVVREVATALGAQSGCQRVVSLAVEAAKRLMLDAASVGIRDVVYFFYPHVPAFTFLTEDVPNEILDYALPRAKALCEGAEQETGGQLRCTFIDTVPVFDGHPEYFNEDIHPNPVGSRAMAEKVWQVMQDHCLGQKGPHDCCEP